MKINHISIIIIGLLSLLFTNCEQNEVLPEADYACNVNFSDTSDLHPKAMVYQEILDRNQKEGIVGVSMLVKDKDGVWMGASGKADIASGIDVKPCNPFLIASISKVFTGAAFFAYVDEGKISLEDSVTKWLPESITSKVRNAEQCQMKHLLGHTSGIVDYYTLMLELDIFNEVDNQWTQEEILAFTYGKKPTNGVGETYYYSNTNYVLLGMILEQVSGESLAEVYQEKIFDPLNLESAYYGTSKPLPEGLVKGYVDFYGNGSIVESEFMFKDELGTGDGGIAINSYDLAMFLEGLMKGKVISPNALAQMTDWFDLPEDWVDDVYGHFQNGYGLERQNTPYGMNIGHTGAVYGYLSVAQYFPEEDATIIILLNLAAYDMPGRRKIYDETLKEMFN